MSEQTGRKYKFIGCEILYREACYLAATGPHQVDVEFLRKGLHDLKRADMQAKIQSAIDAVEGEQYEAILLGYARCNDGLVGVTARDVPVVIPRAHDCITLFFGSRDAYHDYFDRHPGTYYMTTGWAERDHGGEGDYTRPAYDTPGVMGQLGLTDSFEQLVEKYGEDNARFIAESLGDWTKNYSRMAYLEMGTCDETPLIARARDEAKQRGWEFEHRRGDWGLLRKLFAGEWDGDFVVLEPGQSLTARNDERVLDGE